MVETESSSRTAATQAPVIFGCAGLQLTAQERDFFTAVRPLGFILFARNCEEPAQIQELVQSLKETAGHENPLMLIDQEGGRVRRLQPPTWYDAPPAAVFAALARRDVTRAREAAYLNAQLIAEELYALGINVNCAPLADMPVAGSDDIIGDRAFGSDPAIVIALAQAVADGLRSRGVWPVLKHIPGHGRAAVDSHKALPVVDAPLAELERTDIVPFRALHALPLAMTAHIVYTALDDARAATTSSVVIDYIREKIGFKGLLMSDDLSMQALEGPMQARARATWQAGCDVVLHCNGEMAQMQAVAEALDAAPVQSAGMTALAVPPVRSDDGWDVAKARARLAECMQGVTCEKGGDIVA